MRRLWGFACPLGLWCTHAWAAPQNAVQRVWISGGFLQLTESSTDLHADPYRLGGFLAEGGWYGRYGGPSLGLIGGLGAGMRRLAMNRTTADGSLAVLLSTAVGLGEVGVEVTARAVRLRVVGRYGYGFNGAASYDAVSLGQALTGSESVGGVREAGGRGELALVLGRLELSLWGLWVRQSAEPAEDPVLGEMAFTGYAAGAGGAFRF